ncbi:hypothetical protein [uncultured Winogradskyella sp.]|uniref:hypothetical protein n=1 Tax=uncultured Winogradskyella sp. TaxID=395353 RepID=UPI00261873AE|nr:hypothetical protein [uncultured Winogradskyella sp.]
MKLFLLLILSVNIMAQEAINTEFYNIELPKSTTFEKMNSSKEELSNVDVFKILNLENRQIKYLIYLMSNKLNVDFISEPNLNEYVGDIGEVEIVKKERIIFKEYDVYKLKMKLGDNISSIMYLTNINDVLYRLVFMIPKKLFPDYEKEVESFFKSVIFLKDNWTEN